MSLAVHCSNADCDTFAWLGAQGELPEGWLVLTRTGAPVDGVSDEWECCSGQCMLALLLDLSPGVTEVPS